MKRGLSKNHKSRSCQDLACCALALLFSTLGTTSVLAAEGEPTKKVSAAHGGSKAPDANKGFRKKELNFEERVIEGLSNKGYESLSQTGASDALKGEKLYRKRAEFDEDSKSLLREMEYLK